MGRNTNSPGYGRAGRLLRLALLLLLLPVLALLWLPLWLPAFLQQQGVMLQWQPLRWSWHAMELPGLQLDYESGYLELEGVRLDWSWQRQPLQQLHIDRLLVRAQLPEAGTGGQDDALDWTRLAPWLPQAIEIDRLEVQVKGIASAAGSLVIRAAGDRPLWQPGHVQLDLDITQLASGLLDGIPVELQPDSLRVRTLTHADASLAPDALQVLTLDVHSLGQSQLQLSGILALYNQPDWHTSLQQARLYLELPRLQLDGLSLEQLQARLQFSARADAQRIGLQLEQPASLQAARAQLAEDIRAQQLALQLPELTLNLLLDQPDAVQVQGRYSASVGQLQQPLLHPQGWTLAGTLEGGLQQMQATAAVAGQEGVRADSQWQWQAGSLSGDIQLQDVFFRASNPLQKTLVDWPELIEFSNGRLGGKARVVVPASGPMQLGGQINASGLGGIVNRSELAKLDFTALFRLDNAVQLRVDIPKLVVGELNPGVPLSQLTLQQASYSGHLERLEQGTLNWNSLEGQVLGGRFSLPASRLKLGGESRLQVQLEAIQLQEALILYPAEGLQGHAVIDGSIPLLVTPQGVFVEAGRLQAREPGQLRFQSEQIRALGKANPGMQLVADALDDFHFKVLNSGLDYEPSGKLLFNIQLEGENPAVEKGRPIHLNLNLEEDLPALLASIQLGNHVSETIQERIRKRLQNR